MLINSVVSLIFPQLILNIKFENAPWLPWFPPTNIMANQMFNIISFWAWPNVLMAVYALFGSFALH